MSALKYLAAAAVLAAPMLFLGGSAQAITARQQALQGEGLYTTSKGVPEGYGGGYYPQGNGEYGYRRGYRPRGWGWRHRRYYNGY